MKIYKKEFNFYKFGFRTSFIKIEENIMSVYFFLNIGCGKPVSSFAKKAIWFYIDFMNLNVDENYSAKGFTLILKK